MMENMGDPEAGRGSSGDADREAAARVFRTNAANPYAADARKALEDLNAIASRYLLSLHPGGPR
jgi:hypothetical protein